MADMRDRLIELIEPHMSGLACEFESGSCELTNCRSCNARALADHLLANGVILPPCKVGDVVYKISRNQVKACEVVFIGISKDENCSYFNFAENYADGTFYKSYSMGFGEIGKTVFLTREEAEKALREKEK